MAPPVTDEHYRKLERAYHAAPINAYYAPRLRVSRGAAELRIQIQPKMHHAAGSAHGSIYFKALDDAAFFAANSLVADVFLVTASFTLHLFRPVASGTLTARGSVVHESRRLIVAEATIRDDQENLVARGEGLFMRSSTPLGPDVGYG